MSNINSGVLSYKYVYFLGIGGIGMSNLARYFLSKKLPVWGYDRTKTALTLQLQEEGAQIHYQDDPEEIPSLVRDNPNQVLVVLTPAIPSESRELAFFKAHHYTIKKRSEVLGIITQQSKSLCCAGTHGKTTTSSMLAHILTTSTVKCCAFGGGILRNYQTNFLWDSTSPYTVIEADEYDRSFHHLHPYMALITSTDPDHLDIYHTEQEYKQSFEKFTSLISPEGALVLNKKATIIPQTPSSTRIYTYGETDGDFCAKNIQIGKGTIVFDFITPTHTIPNIELGVPIKINIENSIGAMAVAYLNGVKDDELREAMLTFRGVKRRFDFRLKHENIVFVDDYAHHPQEIKACIDSLKALYPHKKLTGIFQPHLYTRTRDFALEFAQSLSKLDELILLDIYPAREKPISGVSSELILRHVSIPHKSLSTKSDILEVIQHKNLEVLLTIGAGDIDILIDEIEKKLSEKYIK